MKVSVVCEEESQTPARLEPDKFLHFVLYANLTGVCKQQDRF